MSAGKAESIARLRTRAVLQARAQTCGQPCAVLGKQCEDDGLFETRCHSCKDATFITSKSTGDTTVYSGNVCMQPDGKLYHT